MSELAKEAGFDLEYTQVEVALILPGNCGCNQARLFLADTPMESVPGLSVLVQDADGPLLRERFETSLSHDSEGRNIRTWIENKRLTLQQFGKKTAADTSNVDPEGKREKRRRCFGAGGDIVIGKKIVSASAAETEEYMTDKDLVLNWGAGGGGIGTSAMEMTAEIADRIKVPVISLLITPFANEGSKMVIANTLRKKLREYGPLLVIRNESLPKAERNVLLSQAYSRINHASRPIFRTLREVTQVVGSESNADLNDLLKAMGMGKDLYIGIWEKENPTIPIEAESNASTEIDCDEVVKVLLHHPFQENEIRAGALMFCFVGPWTLSSMDTIMEGVQDATRFSKEGLVKKQTDENGKGMWVSVMAFGEFASAKSEPEHVATTEKELEVKTPVQEVVAKEKEVSPSERVLAKYPGQPLRLVYLVTGNGSIEYNVPEAIARAWKEFVKKDRLNQDELKAISVLVDEIAVLNPDVVKPSPLERMTAHLRPTSKPAFFGQAAPVGGGVTK